MEAEIGKGGGGVRGGEWEVEERKEGRVDGR